MSKQNPTKQGPNQAEINTGVILAAMDLSGAKVHKDIRRFLEAYPRVIDSLSELLRCSVAQTKRELPEEREFWDSVGQACSALAGAINWQPPDNLNPGVPETAAQRSIQRYIDRARETYAAPSGGDIEIDDDPDTSESDNGVFVQAWVWVSHEDAGVKGDYIIDVEPKRERV